MASDSQTAATLRLKDEIIEHLIDVYDKDANRHERESTVARRYNRVDSMRALNAYANDERLTATALRDYMRVRKLMNAVVDAFAEFAVQYEYSIIENADTRNMGREELANDEKWQALKRLLTEALEGADNDDRR